MIRSIRIIVLFILASGIMQAAPVYAVPSCGSSSCTSCPSNGCSGSAPGPNCRCEANRQCSCSKWCFDYVGGQCENQQVQCSNYRWVCPPPPPTCVKDVNGVCVKPPTRPPQSTQPPRPTPTRGACNCHNLEVKGVIAAGEIITISASAGVAQKYLGTTSIPSMNFVVYRQGTRLDMSGPINTSLPLRTIDPYTGETSDRYTATYAYRIPSTDTEPTEYLISANFVCQKQSASQLFSSGPRVAGIADVTVVPPDWSTPLSAPGAGGLKLGTFKGVRPVKIQKGCDWIRFELRP